MLLLAFCTRMVEMPIVTLVALLRLAELSSVGCALDFWRLG